MMCLIKKNDFKFKRFIFEFEFFYLLVGYFIFLNYWDNDIYFLGIL